MTQYLTFNLGDESFGIDVAATKEILDEQRITAMPRTPKHMLGVINVRGSVVPVFDLRLSFGLAEAEATVDTAIIVLEVPVGDSAVLVGVRVDAVDEVLSLDDSQIDPPPKLGLGIDSAYIYGMGKREDGFILLLDPVRLFSHEELEAATADAADAAEATEAAVSR